MTIIEVDDSVIVDGEEATVIAIDESERMYKIRYADGTEIEVDYFEVRKKGDSDG